MSKWVVDIHGDIEGDYEIIKKYEEPKTDLLEQIRDEVKKIPRWKINQEEVLRIIDKYKGDKE